MRVIKSYQALKLSSSICDVCVCVFFLTHNLFQLEPVGKKTTVWDVNDLACPSEVGGWWILTLRTSKVKNILKEFAEWCQILCYV